MKLCSILVIRLDCSGNYGIDLIRRSAAAHRLDVGIAAIWPDLGPARCRCGCCPAAEEGRARRLVKKGLQGLELLRLVRDLILTGCRDVGGIVAVKIEPEIGHGASLLPEAPRPVQVE